MEGERQKESEMQRYAYIVTSIGKHIPASCSIKLATIREYVIVNPQNGGTSERARSREFIAVEAHWKHIKKTTVENQFRSCTIYLNAVLNTLRVIDYDCQLFLMAHFEMFVRALKPSTVSWHHFCGWLGVEFRACWRKKIQPKQTTKRDRESRWAENASNIEYEYFHYWRRNAEQKETTAEERQEMKEKNQDKEEQKKTINRKLTEKKKNKYIRKKYVASKIETKLVLSQRFTSFNHQ